MRKEDKDELIRLLALRPTAEGIVEDIVALVRKESRDLSIRGDDQISLLASRLFFLKSDLGTFYCLNGILEENPSKILQASAFAGRTMLISNSLTLQIGLESTVYLWDVLKSIGAADKTCVNKYFQLFPSASKYMFEVRGLINSIRDLYNGVASSKTSSCQEIFTRTSKNKYLESSLQLMRTLIRQDHSRFNDDCVQSLKNYRRWAVSNNLFAESLVPLAPLAFIRFAVDYCKFPLPDLSKVRDYAISDLSVLLTQPFEQRWFNSNLNDLWPCLFENLVTLNLPATVDELIGCI
jgi:hypothetical protein